MSYDIHGHWDKKAEHNSPLYPRKSEKGNARTLNVASILIHFILIFKFAESPYLVNVTIEKLVVPIGDEHFRHGPNLSKKEFYDNYTLS